MESSSSGHIKTAEKSRKPHQTNDLPEMLFIIQQRFGHQPNNHQNNDLGKKIRRHIDTRIQTTGHSYIQTCTDAHNCCDLYKVDLLNNP